MGPRLTDILENKVRNRVLTDAMNGVDFQLNNLLYFLFNTLHYYYYNVTGKTSASQVSINLLSFYSLPSYVLRSLFL